MKGPGASRVTGRVRAAALTASRRLAIVLISAAASLLLLEALTRMLGLHFPAIARPEMKDGGLWAYDRSKGWFHVPHGTGRSYLGGPDAGSVRINALGLRGPEVVRPKPLGTQRVLVLGDSYIFGVGVDEAHLFTTRLAQRLARDGFAADVVGAGVTGYSTDQELILLRELGPLLEPDLVVLAVCDNDFEGNGESFSYQQYYKPYFTLSPDGGLAPHNAAVPRLDAAQRVKLWLGQRSNVWNFVRGRQARSRPLQSLIDAFHVALTVEPSADPVELTAALVVALGDTAAHLGASFLTFNTARRHENTKLFHALRPRLARVGIASAALEGPLGSERERRPERAWDFAYDSHWNVAAHRLAAELVAEHVERLLSRGASPAESRP